MGGFFLNFKMALGDLTSQDTKIEEGLNYLLWHFELIDRPTIWPRTISTRTTEGRQILAYDREEAMTRFKQANFLDCRINAYPGHRKGIVIKIKHFNLNMNMRLILFGILFFIASFIATLHLSPAGRDSLSNHGLRFTL